MKTKTYLWLGLAFVATLVLFAACMTPRQTEAVLVLRDLYEHGQLTKEQFEALMAALDPSTWIKDTIELALSVGGTYWLVNKRRDAKRVARGEPVAVPATTPTPQG